jgi:hypothetical protein
MSFQNTSTAGYMDKVVTVKNLSDTIYTTKWGNDTFMIQANGSEQVPLWLANHLMRHGSIDGKRILEIEGTVRPQCGVCSKEFDTKRELGAHSLTHRKMAPKASK